MKRNLLDAAAVELPTESAPKIPDLGKLDSIELPVRVVRVEKTPVREAVLDASEGLDSLTMLALEKAKEILELPLISGDDEFATVLRAQVAQVQAVLTTQARVDEGRFKKKQADRMGELLQLIASEEAKQITGRVLN